VSAGLDWRVAAATTLSAALAYESERFDDDLNSRVLGAATMRDLRAEQALGHGVSVYAALDNALDAEVETAESGSGIESFGPPRALRLGVRLRR
jgi:outer membrane receptor protein involved in Fe transport